MQTPYPDRSTPEGPLKGKSALHQVIDAVAEIERRKVITGPADSVGVLLWNIDVCRLYSCLNAEVTQPSALSSSDSGNYKPGTHAYQPLRTINAEEIKRIVNLQKTAKEEYEAQEEDDDARQPSVLTETFPPCKKGDELNIADVLVTCNFLFRDA